MSKGKEEVEVTVRLSAGQAINELGKLEMQAGDIRNSLKDMKKGSDEFVAATRELDSGNKRISGLRETLGTTGMTLRQLRTYAGELKREFDNVTEGTPKWEALSSKLREVNTAIGQQNAATKPLKGFWESITTEVKQFGMLAVGALGFQFVTQQISNLIEKGAKLSDELSDVQKTTGMTAAEVRGLNSDLSKIDTRTSTSELRKIAAVAGQLGIAKEDIMAFTVATDKLNVALGDEFGGGAEEITKVMGGLRNVFSDIKSDKVDVDMMHIGNAINQLGATGAATGPVVADFANRIGGVGITMGLTSGQVLGLSATLQELNVTTERGGTATVKILQKMAAEPEKFAKVAGLSAKEFAKLVDTDLYGALVKVTAGAAKSGDQATALAHILDTLGVDGAGASEVMAKLGSNTELLQQRVKLAGDSLGNTNSIMGEFATKNDNLAGKMEKLTKLLSGAFTNSVFNDWLESAVDGLSKLVGATDEVQELTKAFQEQQDQVQNLTQNTEPLIARYEELKGKTSLSREEQVEMDRILQQLAITIPEAVTQWDNLGNAVGFNTQAGKLWVQQQKDMLAVKNAGFIQETTEKIKEQTAKIENLTTALNRIPKIKTDKGVENYFAGGKEAVADFKEQIKAANKELNGLDGLLAQATGEKSKAQKAKELDDKLNAILAETLKKYGVIKKAGDDEIGLLADIDAKIKVLREQQLAVAKNGDEKAAAEEIQRIGREITEQEEYRKRLLGQADDKEAKRKLEAKAKQHAADVAAAVKGLEDLKNVVLREQAKLRDADQDADQQAQNQVASHYDELLKKAEDFSKNILLSKDQQREALQQLDLLADEKAEALENLKRQQREKRAAEDLKFENDHALAKANLRILLAKREDKTNPENLTAALVAKEELLRNIELQNVKLTETQRQLIIQDSEDKIRAIRESGAKAQLQSVIKGLEQFQQYANQLISIVGRINQQDADRQMKTATTTKNRKLRLLDQEFKQGIISKESYEAQKITIDEEFASKARNIKRDQFQKQQEADFIKALIAGSLATVRALGEGGIPLAIVVGALAATEAALILSQPTPEFAAGGDTAPGAGGAGRFTMQQALGLPHVNLSRHPGGLLPSQSAFLATVNEEGNEYFVPHRLLGDPMVASSVALIEHIRRGGSTTTMPAFVEGGSTSTPVPAYLPPVASAAAGGLDAQTAVALTQAVNRLNYNLENPVPQKSYVVQQELTDAKAQLDYLQKSSSF